MKTRLLLSAALTLVALLTALCAMSAKGSANPAGSVRKTHIIPKGAYSRLTPERDGVEKEICRVLVYELPE